MLGRGFLAELAENQLLGITSAHQIREDNQPSLANRRHNGQHRVHQVNLEISLFVTLQSGGGGGTSYWEVGVDKYEP